MKNTQPPSAMPIHKYTPYHEQFAVDLPDRTWPTKRITKAPRWCAVDLRDGNQALIDPMSPERKRVMFDLLVRMGYKEIEVGFPSASQTDFDFVRTLIEENLIPDDVTIQVLTQAREELINRTYESIIGAKQAIVHLYNSTSVLQRDVVFRTDKQGIIDIALNGARLCKKAEAIAPDIDIYYEYSPESYTGTELEFARRRLQPGARDLRADARPQGDHQPAGDRRDGDSQRLRRLDRVDVRGTSTIARTCCSACTRTTTAVPRSRPRSSATWPEPTASRAACSATASAPATSTWSPWASTCSRRGSTRRSTSATSTRSAAPPSTATSCKVHERSPWAGDLVYTAFSGSHQDAIKKGFEAMAADAKAEGVTVDELEWAVPYLPVDPKDLGRGYEAVVRVNSQSRQGRRRLPAQGRPRPRPAAQAADRVQRGRAGEDRRRGRRGHERRDLGDLPGRVPAGADRASRGQVGSVRAALDAHRERHDRGDHPRRHAARRRGGAGDAGAGQRPDRRVPRGHGRRRASTSSSTTTSSTRSAPAVTHSRPRTSSSTSTASACGASGSTPTSRRRRSRRSCRRSTGRCARDWRSRAGAIGAQALSNRPGSARRNRRHPPRCRR